MSEIGKRYGRWKVYTPRGLKYFTTEERRAYNNAQKQESRKRLKALNLPEPAPKNWRCNKCKQLKPFDREHFAPLERMKWGLSKVCKRCIHTKQNGRRYGITAEEYIGHSSGACALCKTTGRLDVDHCHETGNVRAGLCRSCNLGLGMFKDDPELMRAAAEYVEFHRMLA